MTGTQFITNTAASGGGLAVFSNGSLTLTASTVQSNTAANYGGGIFNNGGVMALDNSTLSGNWAAGLGGSDGGGALDQFGAQSRMTLNNSTIANNTAANLSTSGLWVEGGAVLTATNSLIANNGLTNNLATPGGTFVSLGNNLSNDWNGQPILPSDKTGNPLLEPLANNGGATWTHALLSGSPAIDSANPATALPTDQRGYSRQGPPDIGAYEFNGCQAATSVVQNTLDTGAGSLRVTLGCARPNATLTFDPSLAGQTITLSSGELIVSVPITVDGSTAPGVRVSGNALTRVFYATAPLTLKALTIQNGYATALGGGLYATGALTLTKVNVLSSTSAISCGGMFVSGATTISGGLFQGNTAAVTGGGLCTMQQLSVTGTQFISNTATNGGGIYNTGSLTLAASTVQSNTADDYGGGIYNTGSLTLTVSTVQSNTVTSHGGGIYNSSVMTLTASTVRGNTATNGGGTYNFNGVMTLTASTVQSNTADGYGGGIFNNGGVMALNNSTLSGNWAAGVGFGDGGGALDQIGDGSRMTLNNSTIVNNTAATLSTSGLSIYQGVLTATNSLIANNGQTNNFATTSGTFVSLGNNLSNAWNGQTTQASDKTGNPLVEPLADNGGATWTHALLIGSPAIDSANPATALPTDQRGYPRQGAPDIGAYEFSGCQAATSVVQNTHDTGAGSLRVTLGCAKPNATLTFDPSLAGQTITLSSGALIVSVPITVDGSLAPGVRVSGNTLTRVFSATAPLTLNALTIQNGYATDDGGGLYTTSALTLTNVNVLSNTATLNGGGVAAYGTTTISGGLFRGNSAAWDGGGLYTSQWLSMTGTQFITNSASNNGGGIFNLGQVWANQSTFISNTAINGGGLANVGQVRLDQSTLISNSASSDGGGINNYSGGVITLTTSTVLSNSARYGGGIENVGHSAVTVVTSTVRGNTATNGGGGIDNYDGSVVTVIASAVLNNTAFMGGGLTNDTGGLVTLDNSTLSGNVATGSTADGGGGAVAHLGSAPRTTLNNSTLVNNTAVGARLSTSGLWVQSGALTATNSLIANNGQTNNLATVGGAFVSLGNNLSNDWNGQTTQASDKTGNPLLGPLADNGGATWTHALLSGSPAINSANPATAFLTDQRGYPRQGTPDIGAYEAAAVYVYLPLMLR